MRAGGDVVLPLARSGPYVWQTENPFCLFLWQVMCVCSVSSLTSLSAHPCFAYMQTPARAWNNSSVLNKRIYMWVCDGWARRRREGRQVQEDVMQGNTCAKGSWGIMLGNDMTRSWQVDPPLLPSLHRLLVGMLQEVWLAAMWLPSPLPVLPIWRKEWRWHRLVTPAEGGTGAWNSSPNSVGSQTSWSLTFGPNAFFF